MATRLATTARIDVITLRGGNFMASLDILNNTQSNLHNVANRMEKRPTLSAMDIQAREQKEMFLKLLMRCWSK